MPRGGAWRRRQWLGVRAPASHTQSSCRQGGDGTCTCDRHQQPLTETESEPTRRMVPQSRTLIIPPPDGAGLLRGRAITPCAVDRPVLTYDAWASAGTHFPTHSVTRGRTPGQLPPMSGEDPRSCLVAQAPAHQKALDPGMLSVGYLPSHRNIRARAIPLLSNWDKASEFVHDSY
jgi:hypothetical protein